MSTYSSCIRHKFPSVPILRSASASSVSILEIRTFCLKIYEIMTRVSRGMKVYTWLDQHSLLAQFVHFIKIDFQIIELAPQTMVFIFPVFTSTCVCHYRE